MRQTLFTLDHFLFQGPLLIGWLVLGLGILAYLSWRHGFSKSAKSFLPVYLIVAAVIYFVLPRLEDVGINPDDPAGPLVAEGLKIRGYGLFLLLGMVAGIGLSLYRCRHLGLDPDRILTLTFWMIVLGLVGARLYYIIQKRDEFMGLESGEMMAKLVDMTKGGLVVYGGFLGAMVAAGIFFWRTKLPFRLTADVLAPGMMLGLAIGRIGCLMNGCCFGGACEPGLVGVKFPATAPAYAQQLADGSLLGIASVESRSADHHDQEIYPLTVTHVQAGSMAEKSGVIAGDKIYIQIPDPLTIRAVKQDHIQLDSAVATIYSPRFKRIQIPLAQLPDRSLKTHPTQLYSAVSAAVLCAVLWFYFPFRRRDGQVFALMLVLYPIGRFLLEAIRQDESGIWGTPLTSAQLLSLAALLIGSLLFGYYRTR